MTTRKELWIILLCLVFAWLPVVFGASSVRISASLNDFALVGNPYWVPKHAGLLYLWTPLVAASAAILFLSPGLMLALVSSSVQKASHWILYGFGLSLLSISLLTLVAQNLLGMTLLGSNFILLIAACTFVVFIFINVRLKLGYPVAHPWREKGEKLTLFSMILIPVIILVCMAPKFYWENFNGDGAHAFETERLLLNQPFPFWDQAAGDIASFPGVTSMLFAYPGSWYIRLFGEVEVAARLPYLLFLSALYGAILSLAEYGFSRPLRQPERWLIWLGLGVYTLVVAYSASYNPYSADIALPATQDTLLMVCFLGFTLTYLRREPRWLLLFLLLSLLSLPNASIMVMMWLAAIVLVTRPAPWKEVFKTTLVLLILLAGATVGVRFLPLFHQPVPGQEYQVVELLKRFAFLQFTDLRRFLFVLVPSGILPAIALLAWKKQDRIARLFTVMTFIYFFFFFFQAHISLHYFIPVMIFPLIVFWRLDWLRQPNHRSLVLTAVFTAGLFAIILSLPSNTFIDQSARQVGETIDFRIGDYQRSSPEIFRASTILHNLFPYDWDPKVPEMTYGGSPLSWTYYAFHKSGPQEELNYFIQLDIEPAPLDARLLAKEDRYSLYIKSDSVWESQQTIKLIAPPGSPLYHIPRGILFRSVPLINGPKIISVLDILKNLGMDTDALRQRLGITIEK